MPLLELKAPVPLLRIFSSKHHLINSAQIESPSEIQWGHKRRRGRVDSSRNHAALRRNWYVFMVRHAASLLKHLVVPAAECILRASGHIGKR